MHKLDYWTVSAQALKAPFDEWRLLLRCVAVPALLYLASMVVTAGLFPDMSLYNLPGQKTALLPDLLTIIPMLMFEWRWMSALWHGDKAELVGPALRSIRWRFIALFAVVELTWYVANAVPVLIYVAFLDMFDLAGENFAFLALAGSLVSIWILTRLTGWNAAVVDGLEIIGPKPVWRLTRGHTWRIFIIGFLVGLPSFLLIFLATILLGPLLRDQAHFGLLILSAPLVVYGRAADNALSLLIYRHLTRQIDEASVF